MQDFLKRNYDKEIKQRVLKHEQLVSNNDKLKLEEAKFKP